MIVLETLERVAEPLPDDSEDGGMWRVCGVQYFLDSESEKAKIIEHDANLLYMLRNTHFKVVMHTLRLMR